MKRLRSVMVSLFVAGLYCAVVYIFLLYIGFDSVWTPYNYEDSNKTLRIVYVLFRCAWIPCLLSIIMSFLKTKIFTQDLILYFCGIISVLYFYFYNANAFSYYLLGVIAFITSYAIVFDIYQINKSVSQKPKEKLEEKKLAQANLSKEKESFQKEYFDSLDNK